MELEREVECFGKYIPSESTAIYLGIVIALLASMYTYAVYFDPTNPEKTVENFYQAYFTKDYDTLASNASVFWAVDFLPQYGNMTNTELLNNRAKIEKDLSKVLADMKKNDPIPEDIKIEVIKSYTKKGNYAAIVVYQIKEAGIAQGAEAAILIKENGRFRILQTLPVGPETLEQIKAQNIDELDANLAKLLTAEK